MLTSKEKGLRLDICNTTGNCLLTYHYPIVRGHYNEMSEIARLHNAEIENIRGKFFIVYKAQGTSTAVISQFRVVQKQFMLHSRECKIVSLQSQVRRLKGEV